MVPRCLVLACVLLALGCDGSSKPAAGGQDDRNKGGAASRPEPVAEGMGSWQEEAETAVDRGIRYLREHGGAEGKWRFNSKVPPDVGITGLALLGMMESHRHYREDDAPWIRDGIKWIVSCQKPDGSIHNGMLATYNTSIAILALVATKNAAYRPVIDKAAEYLRVVQSDEA